MIIVILEDLWEDLASDIRKRDVIVGSHYVKNWLW
jgi:hypothetical protein